MYSSRGCGCNNGIDVLVTIPVACPTPMLMVAARTHPIGRRMAAVVEVGGGSRGGGKGTGKSAEMAPLNYSFFCTVRLSIRLYRLRARILSRLVDSSKEKEEEGSMLEACRRRTTPARNPASCSLKRCPRSSPCLFPSSFHRARCVRHVTCAVGGQGVLDARQDRSRVHPP